MKRHTLAVIALTALIVAGAAVFLRAVLVPPILMYHSIDYSDDRSNKLVVSPASFTRQMEFLKKRNYSVVPLAEMAALIRQNKRIPPKTVAITFDDGYENNFRYAYPVIKKYGFPVTMFVITDFIGRQGFLSRSQILTMAREGLVTIGSHTKTQPWLTGLDDAALREELVGSKQILEDMLQDRVDLFCYPMGGYDAKVQRAVQQAGYTVAVATNPGRARSPDDLYALKRLRISNSSDNLAVFWFEISGFYTWVKEHRDD